MTVVGAADLDVVGPDDSRMPATDVPVSASGVPVVSTTVAVVVPVAVTVLSGEDVPAGAVLTVAFVAPVGVAVGVSGVVAVSLGVVGV